MSSLSVTGIRSHLRIPVVRSGYSLVANAVLTNALGALFWIIAAAHLDPRSLGVGASLISAMTLLAGIAHLGLKNGLIVFVARSRGSAAGLVVRAYLIAAGAAIVLGSVFLVGSRRWAPELSFMSEGLLAPALFLGALVFWVWFVLQDSVLVGLGHAAWVPVENALFGLAKLVGLLLLTAVPAVWAVFASWSVPAVVAVVVVSMLAFSSVRAPVRSEDRVSAPAVARTGDSFSSVLRFSFMDHIGGLFWLATLDLMPLLVLAHLGPEAAGTYYLSGQVAYALYVLSSSLGSALSAHVAPDAAAVERDARRVSRQAWWLVLPGVVAVLVLAPFVLHVFGEEHRNGGVALLRLLAISAIPYTVVSVAAARARAVRRPHVAVVLYGSVSIVSIVSAILLVGPWGLPGVGFGVLLGQSVTAAGLLVWRSSTRLRPGLLSMAQHAVARLAALRDSARRHRAAADLDAMLTHLGIATARHSADTVLSARNDVVIARVGTDRGSRIVKVAISEDARRSIARHGEAVRALRSEPRFAAVRDLVPVVESAGTHRTADHLVELVVPGRPMHLAGRSAQADLMSVAVAVRSLHDASTVDVVVGEAHVEQWVRDPVRRIAAVASRDVHRAARAALAALECELALALRGRRLMLSVTHGDLCRGNVLIDEGGTVRLIDWERFAADGVSEVDLMHLFLTRRSERDGRELGDVVVDLLHSGSLDDDEQEALGRFGRPSGLSLRHLVLLAWLGHVGSNLQKSSRYRVSRRWLRRNVVAVLRSDVALGAFSAGADLSFDGAVQRGALGLAARGHGDAPAPWSEHVRGALASAGRRVDLLIGGILPVSLMAGAVGVWFAAVLSSDPRAMGDTGLVSILPVAGWAALAAMIAVIARALTERHLVERRVRNLIGLYLVAIHGAPAILYSTLRFSWAWKHLGIVDYIVRNGRVDRDIATLDVYHNWPGFFGANAAVVDLLRLGDATAIAMWVPLAFNLVVLSALRLLLGHVMDHRRAIWTAIWLFFISDWLGQDYFSPQAMAYATYLVVLALVLAPGLARRWSARHTAAFVLSAAVVVSHQLTPLVLITALVVLAVLRRARTASLAAAVVAFQFAWLAGPARPYVRRNIEETLASFGSTVNNADANLRDVSRLSRGQAFVSYGGRAVVVALAVMAVIGMVRRVRRGRRDWTALVLLAVPVSMVAANDFGGEILFRAVLFGLPFLTAFAAWSMLPERHAAPGLVRRLLIGGVSMGLVFGFMLGHFGKDRQYRFTAEEVTAATWLMRTAPPGSLLVEGTRNYPSQFLNYDRFVYVSIAREPATSIAEVVADPAGKLAAWLGNRRYAASYLIITRSQKAEVEATGVMPAGSLDRIEQSLLASPDFDVVLRNRDAIIFTRAERSRR